MNASLLAKWEPRMPTFDVRKRDAAYVAAGRWRCAQSPTSAHHVVYDAKGVGVCAHCGKRR